MKNNGFWRKWYGSCFLAQESFSQYPPHNLAVQHDGKVDKTWQGNVAVTMETCRVQTPSKYQCWFTGLKT